jgi:hypothetical protein
VEKQVDAVESTLIAHVKEISIEVAKIGQRLDSMDGSPYRPPRQAAQTHGNEVDLCVIWLKCTSLPWV